MSNMEQSKNVLTSDQHDGTEGFNERLIELSKNYDSQASFATASGVSVSGIQRLLAGGMPRLPILVSIARGNNVNLEWLATGKGAKYVADENNEHSLHIEDTRGHKVDLREFTFIPRYNVIASAGHGSEICEETYMFSMAFRTYWINKHLGVNPKALIAMTGSGDSMPGIINDKDVMIVDTENKSLSDGIYVLRLDGHLLVKQAQKFPNYIIRISSSNPIYEPFEIDLKNMPSDFEVIGCVVHTEPGTVFRYRNYIH